MLLDVAICEYVWNKASVSFSKVRAWFRNVDQPPAPDDAISAFRIRFLVVKEPMGTSPQIDW